MTAVSVIIPIYNVENYIERCTRSLMEQTLDDIEYVFVNDATEDDSMAILYSVVNEYPHRIKQVKYITHDVNKGLPKARHTGLLEATGEYIIHCDSDDYVDREMYAKMYSKAKMGDYDIVVCDYYEDSGESRVKKKGKISEKSDLVEDILLLLLLSATWNKLYKRSIAFQQGIVFPERNMGEDLALTLQYALAASSVGYLPEPLYYYERRPSSISGNRHPEKMLDKNSQIVENFNIALSAFERNGMASKYADAILHEKLWIKNQLLPVMPYQNCTKLWRSTYKEINSKVLFSKVVTSREKLNFLVTFMGLYPLYCRLTKS